MICNQECSLRLVFRFDFPSCVAVEIKSMAPLIPNVKKQLPSKPRQNSKQHWTKRQETGNDLKARLWPWWSWWRDTLLRCQLVSLIRWSNEFINLKRRRPWKYVALIRWSNVHHQFGTAKRSQKNNEKIGCLIETESKVRCSSRWCFGLKSIFVCIHDVHWIMQSKIAWRNQMWHCYKKSFGKLLKIHVAFDWLETLIQVWNWRSEVDVCENFRSHCTVQAGQQSC